MKKIVSRETESLWIGQRPLRGLGALEADIQVDVCVIGAGIAELSTAYLLCREGRSVAVLEARTPGSGQTGRTTAHFSNALDDRYFELERMFGKDGARLAAQS